MSKLRGNAIRRGVTITIAMAIMIGTTSCSLAPDFMLPEVPAPAAYKEEKPLEALPGQWAELPPMEEVHRGQWWRIFSDEILNQLQAKAEGANPTARAALARVEAARATVRASASTLFPTLNAGGNAVRSQPSSANSQAFGGSTNQLKPYNIYSAGAVATYELDVFGRVRDNERALSFEADSEQALYNSTLLALQADVAQHYFSLRALDTEIALLADALDMRREADRIMQRRLQLGAVGEADASRTRAELASTEAELTALSRMRAVREHALAVLLGETPSAWSLPAAEVEVLPPAIPAGLPSALLARRPDVAQAQARMAATNARIGVARAAYFPIFSLTASGGVESAEFSDLFKWSSRVWALGQMGGSLAAVTLFDSGRTTARVDAAEARLSEAAENYRQSALTAFREVEDALSEQRLLAVQSTQTDEASAAAMRAQQVMQRRYDLGDVNYFEVIDAQRTALAAQRAAVQTRGERLLAAVGLIRALGGGWDDPLAPKVLPADPLPML